MQGVPFFTGSGGRLTTIVDDSCLFDGLATPSINDSGEMVFFSGLDGGGSGIFTGAAPLADKVVLVGETLDGSIIDSLDSPLLNIRNG